MVATIVGATQIALSLIRTDGGTQPRAEMDEGHVEDLLNDIERGDTLPPVVVFYDGTTYWLGGGFHRVEANKRAGLTVIEAEIRQGTQDDAIEFSCAENREHGLRRKPGDIERAVRRLRALPKWQKGKKTQQEIADYLHISQGRVSQILNESNITINNSGVDQPVERDEPVEECVKLRTPREVVEQWFADYPNLGQLSNREIAKRCGVTEGTVRNYKKELEERQQVEQEELVLVPLGEVAEGELDTVPECQQVEPELVILVPKVEVEVPVSLIEPEPELPQLPELEPEPELAPIDELELELEPEPEQPQGEVEPALAPEPALSLIVETEPVPEPEKVDEPEPPPEPEHASGIPPQFIHSDITPLPELQEHWSVTGRTFSEDELKSSLLDAHPSETKSDAELSFEQYLQRQEKRQQKEQDREQRRNANRQLIAQAKTIDEALQTAKFATIVIDPPWDWGDEGDVDQFGRANPTYATMSLDELLRLPVGDYADEDCHLYLWITNRSLPKGFQLLDAWGFRYVTTITWVKPSIGMGNYFRGQTEHLLFGVKGSQPLKRKDIGTYFEAPRGPNGHSSKPLKSYELIESCSPDPYLELFARSERTNWTSWGGEVETVGEVAS